MIAVLVMTDGRDDYLWRCLASTRQLSGDIGEWWVHDDTGDDVYRAKLMEDLPGSRPLHSGPRRGFGGAIRRAWSELAARSNADHVFHLEQDFAFARPVDLDAMAEVLGEFPHLAQMALRRQAWNPTEVAAGGVVEVSPGSYTDRSDTRGREWLEHRLFWTTNPSLFRIGMCLRGWPTGARSEGMFGIDLLRDPDLRFGYWGARTDPPWVEHIGHERVGSGY